NPLLQIACMPWPNKQLLLADAEHRKLDPGELNELVRDRMMDCIRGLAAQLVPAVPSVLLGHFSVDVAEAGGMSRLMVLGSDWVLGLHDLTALPFDAVLLAHVHKPQVLSQSPWVGYCGSPECVSHGEETEAKGFWLLDLERQQQTQARFIGTPHRRFLTIDLTKGGADLYAEDLDGAIVRIRIGQATDIDLTALRRELDVAGVHEYHISTERAEAVHRRDTDISASMDVAEALQQWIKQNPDWAPLADELIAEAQAVEANIRGGGD
ncbi:unnamed protein product, partial [marine sediment metagenome]